MVSPPNPCLSHPPPKQAGLDVLLALVTETPGQPYAADPGMQRDGIAALLQLANKANANAPIHAM